MGDQIGSVVVVLGLDRLRDDADDRHRNGIDGDAGPDVGVCWRGCRRPEGEEKWARFVIWGGVHEDPKVDGAVDADGFGSGEQSSVRDSIEVLCIVQPLNADELNLKRHVARTGFECIVQIELCLHVAGFDVAVVLQRAGEHDSDCSFIDSLDRFDIEGRTNSGAFGKGDSVALDARLDLNQRGRSGDGVDLDGVAVEVSARFDQRQVGHRAGVRAASGSCDCGSWQRKAAGDSRARVADTLMGDELSSKSRAHRIGNYHRRERLVTAVGDGDCRSHRIRTVAIVYDRLDRNRTFDRRRFWKLDRCRTSIRELGLNRGQRGRHTSGDRPVLERGARNRNKCEVDLAGRRLRNRSPAADKHRGRWLTRCSCAHTVIIAGELGEEDRCTLTSV